jgi:prephenate dehydrogenase
MKAVFGRVGVFGMGLLGGSVALALRDRFLVAELHAYDPDPAALAAALEVHAADAVHHEIGPWIARLDFGLLAAPVGALVALGQQVAPFAAPGSAWTDVGSVKGPVVEALGALLPGFVGGHPMAGSEHAGVAHAHAGLLQNAVWVLTPQPQTPWGDVDRLRQLVDALGAYPLILNPALHDRLVARVSHLPYLLALALMLMVGGDRDHEHLMFLAAGGFRDLTRVASGSPRMSRDMIAANREALHEALGDLSAVVDKLKDLLDDPDALLERAREAKEIRDSLPVVRRSLLPRMYDVVVSVPDRPGELARITGTLGAAEVNIKDIEVLTIRDAGEAIRLGFPTPEERDGARRALSAVGYTLR